MRFWKHPHHPFPHPSVGRSTHVYTYAPMDSTLAPASQATVTYGSPPKTPRGKHRFCYTQPHHTIKWCRAIRAIRAATIRPSCRLIAWWLTARRIRRATHSTQSTRGNTATYGSTDGTGRRQAGLGAVHGGSGTRVPGRQSTDSSDRSPDGVANSIYKWRATVTRGRAECVGLSAQEQRVSELCVCVRQR
jgi:hypothetical protein